MYEYRETDYLLTIAIPTYNRVEYLSELVPSVITQVNAANAQTAKVEIIISDNASQDGTAEYAKNLTELNEHLSYYVNNKNLGGEGNFAKCFERAKGQYIWIIGDDDIIEPDAVSKAIKVLEENYPALVVCIDALRVIGRDPSSEYRENNSRLDDFTDYRSFLSGQDPDFILAHTWVPSLIISRAILDMDIFERYTGTLFPQMYTIAHGLLLGGKVLLFLAATLKIRDVRAPHNYPKVWEKQNTYLIWLSRKYDCKEIRTFVLKRRLSKLIRHFSRFAGKVWKRASL